VSFATKATEAGPIGPARPALYVRSSVRLFSVVERIWVETGSSAAEGVATIVGRPRSSVAVTSIDTDSPTFSVDADAVAEAIAGGASTTSVNGRSTGADAFPPKSVAVARTRREVPPAASTRGSWTVQETDRALREGVTVPPPEFQISPVGATMQRETFRTSSSAKRTV